MTKTTARCGVHFITSLKWLISFLLKELNAQHTEQHRKKLKLNVHLLDGEINDGSVSISTPDL